MNRENNPNGITVLGGPNFPQQQDDQLNFLRKRPQVDVYVPTEGEVGFSNLVTRALTASNNQHNKSEILSDPIAGCIVNDQRGNYLVGSPISRMKNLDELPSPYLSGILDEFFDDQLKPEIQTNRGCPFTCTFCVDGSALVNKVNKFSLDRVRNEITYICENVRKNIGTLGIADLNFGMYSRDLEICKFIKEGQVFSGYPSNIVTTTGKNSKEKIVKTLKELNGILRMSMSVQSMDEIVLENIGRKNISAPAMLEIMEDVKEAGLRTVSEVIIGLPGDSWESCIRSLRSLFNAGIDNIQMYTLMLLEGSELNTQSQRDKWKFETKYRILPRDFVQLKNGKRVIEIEEVVVGSNSLSFEDYLNLREIAFIIWVTSHGILFDLVRKLLSSYSIDTFELITQMYETRYKSKESIARIFRLFRDTTEDELWDDPKDLNDHYQMDSEWEKLLLGEVGNNVIQYFHGLIITDFIDDWISYTVESAKTILTKAVTCEPRLAEEIDAVEQFSHLLAKNILGENRPVLITESFDCDILGWFSDKSSSRLSDWKLNAPVKLGFALTEDQVRRLDDQISTYGDTRAGRSQAVKRTNVHDLWRKANTISDVDNPSGSICPT